MRLDFPDTPTVGQIFYAPDGIAWSWDGAKWAAGSGGAPPATLYLPLSGGTMSGPLNYTATGATVSRSAQNRAVDFVNVLDFGGDPTGVADSTAAFRAAIASLPNNNGEVYIPAGRYTLTDAVTLGASTVIRGAGRQLTLLQINNTFNMSAQGVFVFGSDPNHAGTPAIKDLWIRFGQPNTAGMTRANLIQYPPAIYKAAATATGRPNLENLMISSAWIGIYLDNCAAYVDNIYMSAFSYGFQWSATTPTLDIVRISNVHFWGFDFLSTDPIGQIFLDGTTNCAWFGRIDGLCLINFFSESSIITVDCGANPAGGYYFFQQIGLDGPAHLVINSNINLQLDSISNSRGNTAVYTTPGIIINGGRNAISNSYLASSNASLPMISVQGGSLQYSGGTTAWAETDTPFMTCSSGALEVRDATFATHLATARTTPVIAQTGTGYVHVSGCRFVNFPVASVSPISITTSANAFIDANNYGAMVQTPPTDYLTISYGNRSIRGDASVPTAAQLSLRGIGVANSLESKLRFFGTFGTAADYSQYLAASLRAGWAGTASWTSSYLNVWLTNANNSAASDANMTQVASFTPTGLAIGTNASTAQTLAINAAAGNNRNITFQTAGLPRWNVFLTNAAEGGSNAGSDFWITRYTDAGGVLDTPFKITRSTGGVSLTQGVGFFGTAPPAAKPTVSGAKGSNAALASLLTALAAYGLVTDTTTA
jgi:hypothetical protein